jgi:DNA-binding NarL/FixJ family response regulator
MKLIAYELGLSQSSVSLRMNRALRKLGLCSRLELAWLLGPPERE